MNEEKSLEMSTGEADQSAWHQAPKASWAEHTQYRDDTNWAIVRKRPGGVKNEEISFPI